MLRQGLRASQGPLRRSMSSGTRTVLGIEYRALDRDHDVDQLFEFNKHLIGIEICEDL